MLAFWNKVSAWLADEEKGASMVEYALLVALIAVIAIVAVTTLGERSQRYVRRHRFWRQWLELSEHRGAD